MKNIVISDYYYETLTAEKELLDTDGFRLTAYRNSTEEELLARAADCDALIVQFAPVTKKVISHLTRCRIIVRYAIGVDNIDLAAADEAGIMVCNVPDYCLDEVSTHTAMLLLAVSRNLPLTQHLLRADSCGYQDLRPLKALPDSVVGLIGFGAIARLLAKKLSGFGPRILAYDPYADPACAAELGVELTDLNTLLCHSDLISVHCPLTTDTRGLIDADAFAKMKRGVCLVNTARGGIIDETALLDALNDGIVSAAGLDVLAQEPVRPDHPLLKHPNVILTPHVAWYSETSAARLQRSVAEEVRGVLEGQHPRHMVNHPAKKEA